MRNTLFYGDNLEIMREHIADESVDLVYLDPPFNSARDYNVLFKQAKKDENQAQITAFTDTWQWSKRRYEEFFDDPKNARLFDLMESLHRILGTSEMMALDSGSSDHPFYPKLVLDMRISQWYILQGDSCVSAHEGKLYAHEILRLVLGKEDS